MFHITLRVHYSVKYYLKGTCNVLGKLWGFTYGYIYNVSKLWGILKLYICNVTMFQVRLTYGVHVLYGIHLQCFRGQDSKIK